MAEKDVVVVAPAQELSKDCNNNNNNNTIIVQQPSPSTSLSTTITTSMMNRSTITVAFIVGMNHEWLHGRCLYGDIAFVNTIRRFIYINNNNSQSRKDDHKFDIDIDIDVEECIQFMNEYNITSCHQLHDQLIQFIHRINHKHRRHNNNSSNDNNGNNHSSRNVPRDSSIQFIFYLGGHGEAGHYCVNTNSNHSNSNKNDDHDGDEYRWYYKDILHTLQQQLQSNDTIYMIIDTCYSGSLQHVFINQLQLQEHCSKDSSAVATNGTTSPSSPDDDHKWYTTIQVNDTIKIPSFFIFMSTKHNMTAGPEWTMTQGFIDAMNGTILNQQQHQYNNKHTNGNGSRNTLYDPTNRKHSINNNTTKVKSYSLSMNDFIYTLHHMIQYYKENEMQFLHVYNNMNNNKICLDLNDTPFPFYCCCNTQQVHEQQQNISNETNITNYDSSLQLIDQMQQLHINKRNHNTHGRNTIWKRLFSSHCTKQLQLRTQLGPEYTMMYVFYLLANNGQYRYHSNENNDKNNNSNKCNNKYKPGTKVWCIFEDHTELYLGTIMNDIDVPWNDFIINDSNNDNQHKNTKRLRRKFQRKQQQQSQKQDHLIALPNPDICYGFGPCIPILWDADHTWSFIPIGQCYVIDNNDHNTNLKNEHNNNSSSTSANSNVIVTTKQRPKLRIARKQAFDSLQNEIRNLTSIPTTMNITYYCILRNFHSMGKQLCFTIQDIYNEIQHNTINNNNNNSDEITVNNESSAQYQYDSMEMYFVQCPETRHLLHNLIDTPKNGNDIVKSLRTNTKSSKNKFKKNQNDMTNQPSQIYSFQIAKNMTHIYNVPIEALLAHVLYNTIPSCGMNYCIVQRTYNNDSNTNVDPKNSNHCNSNDVAKNKNNETKEQSHDYYCVPISSLRIVMKARE